MSQIPINDLRSVTDPVIPVWNEEFSYEGSNSGVLVDTLTRYRAFWQKVIIRNYGSQRIRYRTKSTGPYTELPQAAERTLDGWGSYFELQGQGGSPVGTVTIYMCRREDVYVQR